MGRREAEQAKQARNELGQARAEDSLMSALITNARGLTDLVPSQAEALGAGEEPEEITQAIAG